MTTELRGVLTALATPFTESGELDLPKLRFLVDRSVNAGVGGVVAGGSTGEFAALSTAERELVVQTVIRHTAGRVPVIAQTGATSTVEAIRLSKAAEAAGADVLMLVTPYYEALTLEETVDYIKTVARAVSLPVMLYNIPDATGVNLDPQTISSLAREVENIRYVKDSSANFEQALQLIHHHSQDIATFIGWDAYTFSALAEGAAGVMAGAANVVPEQLVDVARRIGAGDITGALQQWRGVYPVIDSLLSLPFISAIKEALKIQGHPVGDPRHPVSPLTPEQAELVVRALQELPENSLIS
ncbi:4-hydroxy-tetrahydrodipicolinate synthase [Glutamicibacter sp. MNS18]|uniref:4-hydroxy-tetrahydrodipicolinate synthase n=1 Tax=Glutamicibacter sp. MNS18 TaxID=2989817 RepID=UPI0022356B02|nr:4-hydroxy-tetrahydrodipicolinate synthase [Glutamicibacter sp. MNS18]MCW4466662.1 4-hydroxy-tetrahydrodipicolinate synthase [Glutamicibacter sp. MNS18]